MDEGSKTFPEKLRSQVARTAWGIARDTAYIHVSLQKVQQYEEALATVKESMVTGSATTAAGSQNGQQQSDESLKSVVDNFQKTEAQNYSLYNYVSELDREAEQLEEEIDDMEQRLARHRSYGIGNGSQTEFQGRRQQLEDILNQIDAK